MDNIENCKEGTLLAVKDDGGYQVFKVLDKDLGTGTMHLVAYGVVAELPRDEVFGGLVVETGYLPMDFSAFEDAQVVGEAGLSSSEVLPYLQYLKENLSEDMLVAKAQEFYKAGYAFSDQKDFALAELKYSMAIELIPNFVEAIENRAFCKMDTGRYEDAAEDFKLSLNVSPGGFLAEFSLGECYLNMEDYENAKIQFEKACAIDPTHPTPKEYLEKTIKLMSGS